MADNRLAVRARFVLVCARNARAHTRLRARRSRALGAADPTPKPAAQRPAALARKQTPSTATDAAYWPPRSYRRTRAVTSDAATTNPPDAECRRRPGEADAGDLEHGFRFGSYGRVLAGTDLRGGQPEQLLWSRVRPAHRRGQLSRAQDVVRLRDMKSRRQRVSCCARSSRSRSKAIRFTTPACSTRCRRSATSSSKRGSQYLTGWVGSRMYRGDDIYLFDYVAARQPQHGRRGRAVPHRVAARRAPLTTPLRSRCTAASTCDDNDYQYRD